MADVPEKIWQKVVNLEYVEMADLLPESWSMRRLQEEQGLAQSCHSSRSVRKGPVTNLLLWLEGYTILVAIISTAYPVATPELMAYQRRIIWAASTFEGSAWVTYDSCYRRRAARLRSLCWSVEDTSLAQEAFAGRARVIARCSFCLSRTHTSKECPLAPERASESSPQPSRRDTVPQSNQPRYPGSRNLCGLYNAAAGNRCYYRVCRFDARCRDCGRAHPASGCPDREGRDPGRDGKRSPSPRGRKRPTAMR